MINTINGLNFFHIGNTMIHDVRMLVDDVISSMI